MFSILFYMDQNSFIERIIKLKKKKKPFDRIPTESKANVVMNKQHLWSWKRCFYFRNSLSCTFGRRILLLYPSIHSKLQAVLKNGLQVAGPVFPIDGLNSAPNMETGEFFSYSKRFSHEKSDG